MRRLVAVRRRERSLTLTKLSKEILLRQTNIPACNAALALALLHRQLLDTLHESRRRHGPFRKVGRPIKRPSRQDHVAPLFANENFPSFELKLLRQPNCSTAIVHEDLRFVLHTASQGLMYMPMAYT